MRDEMTEDKGIKPRTWNAIATGALLISIALGMILYSQTDSLLSAFAGILLVFGAYTAAVLIIIVAVVGMAMAVKNRNV